MPRCAHRPRILDLWPGVSPVLTTPSIGFVRLHFGGLSSSFATDDQSFVARGCSAVGSASPCQGEGRGFESRHPLEGAVASTPAVEWPSGEATACKAVHTGSIPVSTSMYDPARLAQRESASLTRKRSLDQSQYRAPASPQFRLGI